MRLFVVLFLLIVSLRGQAQYFQFSQYNFTDQRINPALVASSDYAVADLIFRNQNTGGDIHLKSTMISCAYPFLSRKNGMRWSGLGMSLLDDRSGGIFRVQEASVSYAVNVFINRFQTLALGFKGLYQQQRVNLAGLFTGSQYIDDRGFDASLFSGENFALLRSDFVTFSTGLFWQQNDREGKRKAFWGISLFDLNKPENSLSGMGSQLNSTWVLTGGATIYEIRNMSVTPEFLLTGSASNHVLSVGAITGFDLAGIHNKMPGRMDVITKYVPGRSVIAGLQFQRDNFAVGFSYDFSFFKRNPGNVNSFEVGVRLKRLVDPRLKKRWADKNKVAAKTKNIPNKATVTKTASKKDITSRPVVVKASVAKENTANDLGTSLRVKRDSVIANAKAGQISHEPFVIERMILYFNFQFNSTSLDESSTKYLDDLSVALTEDPNMNIRLTGHTDNIGSGAFNMRLSFFRANAIRDYIMEKGIDASRIETQGKGLSEPMNENKTEAERALNRRVELIIFYKE
jgi:type IX secretion system PorP/SprF family membrane protein